MEAALSEEWKTRKSLIWSTKASDDDGVWDEFVKYYEKFIYYLLHRMQVPSNDFEDLVQTILVKLWKNIKSYDPEKSRFRTWLSVVIRNVVWDYYSEVKRRDVLLGDNCEFVQLLEEQPPTDVEAYIEREWVHFITGLAMERVQKVFSGEAVNVLIMSLDNVPARAIAAELGLTLESVYTLKNRVKARFIKEVRFLMDELEG
jgi:RNA polymerase sigma-70 factor (ECF subfamily)